MLEKIYELLKTCTTDTPLFPPTLLFNEGWLLRLILDWFSSHRVLEHPLVFFEGANWYSETLLPSAFQARYQGDKLAESRTHADGVIGHFRVGSKGKTDFELRPDAMQFVVLEAKIYSSLSHKLTRIPYFDQAARNVACIAEVLKQANRSPHNMKSLGFYVLAPHEKISQGNFSMEMDRSSILQKVQQRVKAYSGAKSEWFFQWFQPAFERIRVGVISWEDVIATIQVNDPESASSIRIFFEKCMEYNRKSVGEKV